MTLIKDPFEKILSGKKSIELRLYDKKRRSVNIGDIIIFKENNLFNGEVREISRIIKDIVVEKNFTNLFKKINLKEAGFESDDIPSAIEKMASYYSEDNQSKYKVCALFLV